MKGFFRAGVTRETRSVKLENGNDVVICASRLMTFKYCRVALRPPCRGVCCASSTSAYDRLCVAMPTIDCKFLGVRFPR